MVASGALRQVLGAAAAAAAMMAGGCVQANRAAGPDRTAGLNLSRVPAAAPTAQTDLTPVPEDLVIAMPASAGIARPPFAGVFDAATEKMLEEVQYGAFKYFWETGNPTTGMIPDRSSKTLVSVAGVGFQMAAIVIGVERGWITKAQGAERCERMLRALLSNPVNRYAGVFQHFVDGTTAGLADGAYEQVVSTIDSALLFSGALVASEYFGGEVARLADEMVAAANWQAFVVRKGRPEEAWAAGNVSLGWKITDKNDPVGGGGELLPYAWIDSGCEHRLVNFLAVAAPKPEHRLPAENYYRLRRGLGDYRGTGPMVWFPYSGALFVNAFSHCFIDYAGMGPDNPAAFGQRARVRVDWWENSRRMVNMHRAKAIDNAAGRPGFGENGWGLTASDFAGGYQVPGVFPEKLPMPWAKPNLDYSTWAQKDNYGDGTLAPYGAGMAIMFEPKAAAAALAHYKALRGSDGKPLVWGDPWQPESQGGGYGFLDAFNQASGWVAPEYVAIDQGPLIIAIENARTGLIWRLFHRHRFVQSGMERLGLEIDR
ncbi:MAG: hypothetical protein IOD15_03725 [Phycisphaerales bacterium]|jgi:hypothetical protein|nr:hypothetical protein [Phycisphaerales bacterium]